MKTTPGFAFGIMEPERRTPRSIQAARQVDRFCWRFGSTFFLSFLRILSAKRCYVYTSTGTRRRDQREVNYMALAMLLSCPMLTVVALPEPSGSGFI
jgi:hypothetical protein